MNLKTARQLARRALARTANTVVVLGLVGLAVTWGGSPAAASPGLDGNPLCPHGGNFISTACFRGGTHIDVFATWHNNTMSATTGDILDGGHINHALWTYSGDPCGDRFVEVGLTKGFEGSNVYTWYYARDRGDANGGYSHTRYLGATPTNNGMPYEYHLKYAGTDFSGGVYEVWLGGVKINGLPENYQGFGSCMSATGLEVQKHFLESSPRTGYSSDYFDAYNLRFTDTGGTQYPWNNVNDWWRDFPCGVTTCFEGVYPFSDYWQSRHR